MNRKATLALYAQGREAWNGWAEKLLARRKAIEAAGDWSAEESLYITPKNEATRKWIDSASADFSSEDQPQTFSTQMHFEGFLFPFHAWFNAATFEDDAWFTSATFSKKAWFLNAKFSKIASFTTASFEGEAMFAGTRFSGDAFFDTATFLESALFGESTFSADARFEGVKFQSETLFTKTKFKTGANFDDALFRGDATFDDVVFGDFTGFNKAEFRGKADFNSTTFAGKESSAYFEGTKFRGEASFGGTFAGDASFDEAQFDSFAAFEATFSDGAGFRSVVFGDMAVFEGTAFYSKPEYSRVIFSNSTFRHEALFDGVLFDAPANFGQATFLDVVSFSGARFEKSAEFSAIRSERAFSLAGALFASVPDFIQAHFSEAPRLDDLDVRAAPYDATNWWPWSRRAAKRLFDRFLNGDPNNSARWRALKRLAIQGHDHEREQTFFAMEIRAARFANDWPLPLTKPRLSYKDALQQNTSKPTHKGIKRVPFVFWRGSTWAGFSRFWLGIFYEIFSDFGRSILRPVFLWVVVVTISVLYFLGQNPTVEARRNASRPTGLWSTGVTYAATAIEAWRTNQPCVEGGQEKDAGGNTVASGLAVSVRNKTSAANEALQLALRNGLIILDGGGDATYRIYGCLYGIERIADKLVPIVPSTVSYASLLQKVFSGVAIFLLGLGLRNMLRMR